MVIYFRNGHADMHVFFQSKSKPPCIIIIAEGFTEAANERGEGLL